MKISYNWLKQYLHADLAPEAMAALLTDIGLEVEGLERIEGVRGGLAGVVVGEVLTCVPHPDSDHLHLTTVDAGGDVPLPIVCGAPNVAAGQKVLLATVGAVLWPVGAEEPVKIKRGKIRGAESLGMICAADELGIGTGHDGIMVLDASAVPGTPACDYLGIRDDWQLEIGLTPNRADAASHLGVARDLYAALTVQGRKASLTPPDVAAFAEGGEKRPITVEVREPEAAPRYAGVVIRGVKVGPSPDWLQERLRSIGLNPHNNVVDVTNFVLHELGQPLHSFDAGKIRGGRVVVRTVAEGTPFTTLDGVERRLGTQDLMICDAEVPLGIAGVMGGKESAVNETTTDVFLESAYFNPVWIRRTAKRLGINSDASFRFERGIDPDGVIRALKRAALLIVETSGGRIGSDIVDLYPQSIAPFRFDVSLARIDALIGQPIPTDTVRTILRALDIVVEREDGDRLTVAVPPFRVDVRREVDLTEELLRMYGYNNIEIPTAVRSSLTPGEGLTARRIAETAADWLAAQGFTEIMSNSLTRAAYYEQSTSYPAERCVTILNPLSNDLNVMRQTLLFNALEAATLNANRRNADLRLFELGNCYSYDASRAGGEEPLAPYTESFRLGLLITGNLSPATWNAPARPADFFALKSVLEKLFARLGVDWWSLQSAPLENDLFAGGLGLRQGEHEVVHLGRVAPAVRKRFDLRGEVWFAEIDFDRLARIAMKQRIATAELSRFPEVRRDLALLVDSTVTFEQLRRLAFSTERKLLRSVTLFDVYEGDKLPAGKKSYALGFVLEDRTRTLTDRDIDRAMQNLLNRFERETGAVLRN